MKPQAFILVHQEALEASEELCALLKRDINARQLELQQLLARHRVWTKRIGLLQARLKVLRCNAVRPGLHDLTCKKI